VLISWEANERSCRGTWLHSHGAWHRQRSRSPQPRARREQPVGSPAPAVVARAWSRAEERTGHPRPSCPREAAGAAGTARRQCFIPRVSARATCRHGTHGKGTWRCRRARPPEHPRWHRPPQPSPSEPLGSPQLAQAARPWHAELQTAKTPPPKKGDRALPSAGDAVAAVPRSAGETSTEIGQQQAMG